MNSSLIKDILNEVYIKNGQRLVLRKPREEDAEQIIKYLNAIGGESDNLLFGKDEVNLSVEQEVNYLRKINSNPNAIMILGTINNVIVSISQLNGSREKRVAHNSELSISVRKEYWRMGIGNAVMKELIKFATEHNIIKNISLGVKASNSNAIKLYEKFGFKKIGVHKNYFNVNGKYDDEILMDLYLMRG